MCNLCLGYHKSRQIFSGKDWQCQYQVLPAILVEVRCEVVLCHDFDDLW